MNKKIQNISKNILLKNNNIRNLMKKKRIDFFNQENKVKNISKNNSLLYDEYSKKCQEFVLNSNIWKKSKNIALYLPVNNEVDTHILIKNAYQESKNIYFPRCLSEKEAEKKGIMEFVLIDESIFDTAFEIASYGILEPIKELQSVALPEKTLVILPCLVYNMQGFRLGYGGGYYDRLLAKNFTQSHSLSHSLQANSYHYYEALLLAFSFQENTAEETSFIPQCWDIPVQFISTERGFLCCNT